MMLLAIERNGIVALRDMESAVCSASIVEVAMHGWSLEHQITGQLINSITNPVLDLTDSGLHPSSVPQPLAKSESTYTSTGQVPLSGEGQSVDPSFAVPFRWRPVCSCEIAPWMGCNGFSSKSLKAN